METNYGVIDKEAYVAKYVDENGCSLEEACEELDIDPKEIFNGEK